MDHLVDEYEMIRWMNERTSEQTNKQESEQTGRTTDKQTRALEYRAKRKLRKICWECAFQQQSTSNNYIVMSTLEVASWQPSWKWFPSSKVIKGVNLCFLSSNSKYLKVEKDEQGVLVSQISLCGEIIGWKGKAGFTVGMSLLFNTDVKTDGGHLDFQIEP